MFDTTLVSDANLMSVRPRHPPHLPSFFLLKTLLLLPFLHLPPLPSSHPAFSLLRLRP